jgi:hypothetical protein
MNLYGFNLFPTLHILWQAHMVIRGMAMQQVLVERRLRGSARSHAVNVAESPLGWLMARGLISERQFTAGEQLRGDDERAAMGANVTMNLSVAPIGGQRSAPDAADRTTRQLTAKAHFEAAIAAAGPGLSDILWRTVCACEALPVAEKALGWPARSGRLVLTLALDRIADYYRVR